MSVASIVRGVRTYVKDVPRDATPYEALLLGRGLIWDLQKVNQFLVRAVSESTRQRITREIHYDYSTFTARLAQAADMQSDSRNTLLMSVSEDVAQALTNLPQVCRAMAGGRPISKTDPTPLVDDDNLPSNDTLARRIKEIGIWLLMGELAAANLADLLALRHVSTLPRIYAWSMQLEFFGVIPLELVVSLSDDLRRLSAVAERNMHIDAQLPRSILQMVEANVHSPSIEASMSLFTQVQERRAALLRAIKRDRYRLTHIDEELMRGNDVPHLRKLQLTQIKKSLLQSAVQNVAPFIALNARTVDVGLYTRGVGFPDFATLMRAAIPYPHKLANAPHILLQQWAQEGRVGLLRRDAGYDGLRALEHARNLEVIVTSEGTTYVAGMCVAALAGACPLQSGVDDGRCERLAEVACQKESAVPQLRAIYDDCRAKPSPDERSKCIEGKWAAYVNTDEGSEAVCRADVSVNYVPARTQPSVEHVTEAGCNTAARRFGGDFAKCVLARDINRCVTELVGSSELLRGGMQPSTQYCIGKTLAADPPPPLQALMHLSDLTEKDPCAFASRPKVAQAILETRSLCETCFQMSKECEALHPKEPRLASKACLAGWVRYCRSNECPVANIAATHLVEEAQTMLNNSDVTPDAMRRTLEEKYNKLYAQRPARQLLANLKAVMEERSKTRMARMARMARDVDAQASEVQKYLLRGHDQISKNGGATADDLSDIEELVLEFLKTRAKQMRSMQTAYDILHIVERTRWVSMDKCRRALVKQIENKSDSTLRRETKLWCNATMPDASTLKDDAQKASEAPKGQQKNQFDVLLRHRRQERMLDQLGSLVVRMGRSANRVTFISTGLFHNEKLRVAWRTKQVVAEWYDILRNVGEPRAAMPLGIVPVSEAKNTEQIRQALDAQVLQLAMQMQLKPCTYNDTVAIELPSATDAGLTSYGIKCASDEALLFMMHVRALADAREPDADTDSESPVDTGPLVVHPFNLKAVYRNFAHEIVQLDANRALSRAQIGIQRREDVLSMSFIYDFCMDCVFRRDPMLKIAHAQWNELGKTSHRGTSLSERQLPLPSMQCLYLMRMAWMCVPTTTRSHATELLLKYVEFAIAPLVGAVRKTVTDMLSTASADPKQLRRSAEHARNVTSVMDDAVGSRLTQKVDQIGQVIDQKRRAVASRKGVDAFHSLRMLNTPGESRTPTKGTSLVAATVAVPALAHNFRKVYKILNPMRKTHKKILPGLDLIRNLATTGATLGTLHRVGAGTVVDGAMSLIHGGRSKGRERPEDAGVEGLNDRQREFYDIQNIARKFQHVNVEVYDEYALFIQTAIASFYLEADDGSVDAGGVKQMAELLLELVVHGDPPGGCDLYHDTELTPPHTPAVTRLRLDQRLRTHGLMESASLS